MASSRVRFIVTFSVFSLLLGLVGRDSTAVEIGRGPIKVFILAGQSNMQGHGSLASADWLGQDPKYGHLLEKIKRDD